MCCCFFEKCNKNISQRKKPKLCQPLSESSPGLYLISDKTHILLEPTELPFMTHHNVSSSSSFFSDRGLEKPRRPSSLTRLKDDFLFFFNDWFSTWLRGGAWSSSFVAAVYCLCDELRAVTGLWRSGKVLSDS